MIFLEKFRNSKILLLACQNLSQIDVTQTLRPFSGCDIFFTYDLEY